MRFHTNNVGREVIINGVKDTIGQVSASGEWFRLKGEENNSIAQEYWLHDIQYARLLTILFKEDVLHDVAICRQDYKAPKEKTVLPKESDALKGFVVTKGIVVNEDTITTVVVPDSEEVNQAKDVKPL